MRLHLPVWGLFFLAAAAAAEPDSRPETRVAVQTIGEPATIVETIATTLDHLRDEIPSRRFILEYYDRRELPETINAADDTIIFITDAVTFAELSGAGRAQAIASMKLRQALDANHTAGATFIVRSDRSDLAALADLQGQSAEAARKTAGESYIIGMHEIQRIFGNKPFFSEERVIDAISEQVAHDVVSGKVDVGIVEACLLEEMEAKGNIPRDVLRVVGERNSRDLHCRHSTGLHPGWVLAITIRNGELNAEGRALASDVAPILSTVPKLTDTFEWSQPSDPEAYLALLAELRRSDTSYDLSAFVKAYWPYAAGAAALFIGVLLHGIYVSWLVRRRTAELERVMNEREALRQAADEERERMASFERAGIAGQLSSMIAHELTQPLNAVVNYARGLRIRLAGNRLDSETLSKTLVHITEQGMIASQIVTSVRGYARNGEAEVTCELGELLDDAITRFCRARPEAPVPTVYKLDKCFVEGHPMELSLLIHNLLKNADEACRSVKFPKIETAVDSRDGFVSLTVSDNGPELDDNAVERLFEPLHTTKAGGLGLGLAICRRIAEAHGGRINAHKSAAGRLIFTLVLPQSNETLEDSL